jgi:hypothetical protein
MALGGIAGGQKFIVQDILFKFAVDFEGLYGGDAFAMKGAGHDLAGLMAYMSAIELRPRELRVLHVPLMALIDYRGYRLVAICVLPIGRNTICYGSFDAGKTVHYEHAVCNAAMKEVGAALNIMGHRSSQHPHLIYAPIDIEAHLGRDKKFYVLDFARYMPPQPPSGKWGASLYELLRPELVASSPVPLSPDAFSTMGHPDDAKQCRQAIRDLFSKLVRPSEGGVIFEYAKAIDALEGSASEVSEQRLNLTVPTILASHEVLVREMHSRGINMRFLGLLRSFCTHEKVREFLLGECLARLWKCELRHMWRDVMRKEKASSAEPFRKVTSAYLNLVVGQDSYWAGVKQSLMEKFPSVLSAEEQAPGFDLRVHNGLIYWLALPRLFLFLNVELDKTTYRELMERTGKGVAEIQKFEFVAGDIVQMGCRIKHMNTVDKADAAAYMYQAAKLSRQNPATGLRLVNMALGKLLTAMKTCGTDLELQFKFCLCRIAIFKLDRKPENCVLAAAALSALTKKLEELNAPLLPTVRLQNARLLALSGMKFKEGTVTAAEDLQASADEAFAALALHKKRMEVLSGEGTSQEDAYAAVLPFLIRTAKCLSMLFSSERLAQEYLKTRAAPFVALIDELLPLSRHPKFFASHPIVGLWLWWLLFQHAVLLRGKVEVPLRTIQRIVDDANSFLVRASQADARVLPKFVRLLRASSISDLHQYLPAAEHSAEVMDTFVRVTSPWKVWQCRGLALPRGTSFARLVGESTCITKLKLNGATGIDEAGLLLLFNSQIRNTLESASFPCCLKSSAFLLSFTLALPRLRALSMRGMAAGNAEVSHFVKLCPSLAKLDLSMTFAQPDPQSLLIPEGLTKLDVGFPRESWDPQVLMDLLLSDKAPNLTFLGLAGTAVCDLHLSVIFSAAPHLVSLDLCRTLVSERFLLMAVARPTFSSLLRNIWLPRGVWYPLLADNQELTVKMDRNIPPNISLLVSKTDVAVVGKRFAGGGGVAVAPDPRTHVRKLHVEKLTPQFFAHVDRSEPFGHILDSQFMEWSSGPKGSETRAKIVQTMRMPTMKAAVQMTPPPLTVHFEGEVFRVQATQVHQGKIGSFTVFRESTKEQRMCRIAPAFGGPRLVNVTAFAGVGTIFWIVVFQALGYMHPTLFEICI